MRPIDPKTLHDLEATAREIGHLIGGAVDQLGKGQNGFCLMLYSFDGPELTWISNSNRDDMIKVLSEFKKALKENMADTLSRPKGSG
jgi:hypothetical protein